VEFENQSNFCGRVQIGYCAGFPGKRATDPPTWSPTTRSPTRSPTGRPPPAPWTASPTTHSPTIYSYGLRSTWRYNDAMCRPYLNSIVGSVPSYAALGRTLSDATETVVPYNTTIILRSHFDPTPASGPPSVIPASVFVVITAPALPLPPIDEGPFCGLSASDLTASLSVRTLLRLYYNPFLVAQVGLPSAHSSEALCCPLPPASTQMVCRDAQQLQAECYAAQTAARGCIALWNTCRGGLGLRERG
jgi:hypothetical protein